MKRDQQNFAPQNALPGLTRTDRCIRSQPLPVSAETRRAQRKWNVIGQLGVSAIVLALIIMLFGDRTAPLNVGAAFVLFGLGAGLIGFGFGTSVVPASDNAAASLPDTDTDPQRALLMATIPLWVRQLEAVRQEGDRAVEALARSFEDIVVGLENALNESRNAVAGMQACGGVAVQLNTANADLNGLVQAIQTMHGDKGVVMAEIVRCGRELREVNDEVNQLALHTRLLSLNAAIEAARAGAAGRPFGVVVTEMRVLATRSSEASRRVAGQLNLIEAAVQSVQQQENFNAASEHDPISQAKTAITAVMNRVTALSESLGQSAAIMDDGGVQVRKQISDALVALQFQDRVSQILGHTANDLKKLEQHLAAGTLDDDVIATWQTDMTAKFSTPEEFASVGHAQGKRKSDDVTYF